MQISPCRMYHAQTVGRSLLRMPDGKSAFKTYYISVIGRDKPELYEWRRCPRTHAEVNGRRLRLPTTRDLASVAGEPDEAHAALKLVERLVDGEALAPEVAGDELASALDAADPRMDLSLALSCLTCAHRWSAPFDVPAFLWEEIDVRARRLLDEVHALARAYGWNEGDILALSDTRRRAYLERVLA